MMVLELKMMREVVVELTNPGILLVRPARVF